MKEASDSGVLETTGPVRPTRFRKLPWAAGLALLLAAAVAGVWIVRFRVPVPEAVLVPVPLTSYPGTEEFPSFSPDGTQVAFQWCPEGKECQIYIKQIGVEPSFRLTHSKAPSDSPAWSPDGQTIAVTRELSETRLALILIPQRGGRERVLAEFDDEVYSRYRLNWPFLAWTPDSQYLVSQVSDPSDSSRSGCALFIFSVKTGEKRRLTTTPYGWEDAAPAFSPDGRTLVFSRGTGDQYDLYLLRLAEGYTPQAEPERIASDNVFNIGAAWTPDGREIVFCSGKGFRSYGLWRVAAASARPRRVAFASEFASQPAISRQGNRLAYAVRRANCNIWGIDLGGPGHKSGIPLKVIASTKQEMWPAYSPDGTRIAFVSDRSGAAEIWVSESDGSNAAQLTSVGSPGINGPQWSPGAENIAFQAYPAGGNNDIYVVSANGGAVRRLTTNAAPKQSKWPSWSRDGKWLYFSTGSTGIWKMPASGGEAVRVIPRKGAGVALAFLELPRESPDGKWLYYVKHGKGYPDSLWRMPVDGGGEVKVLDPELNPWSETQS